MKHDIIILCINYILAREVLNYFKVSQQDCSASLEHLYQMKVLFNLGGGFE